jgi:alpha-L-rhamnosidase
MSAKEIKKGLLQAIHRQEDTLTTGFIGVRFLLPVLSEIGETELAYKLMRETKYPSWGYSVLNGATTIWERWNGYTQEEGFFNPSMNAFNHYSLGSCVYWLYAYVLGIKRRGKGSFLISPDFSNQLDYAKGRYDWDGGEVRVEWRYEADEICLTVGVLGDADVVYDFGDSAVLRKEERDGERVFYISAK